MCVVVTGQSGLKWYLSEPISVNDPNTELTPNVSAWRCKSDLSVCFQKNRTVGQLVHQGLARSVLKLLSEELRILDAKM